ncbi:hypothetical protein DPMN_040922 [Dreissena polymorpha]|uniref:Centrosomal protein of 57 kDa n=1 Tax=Dreissena polymorpha TaxID=45954 RepID=A0A9D4HVR7_DREPO|nr:hypothetical protein DPMN_040922 [Dreissena polymorpha]
MMMYDCADLGSISLESGSDSSHLRSRSNSINSLNSINSSKSGLSSSSGEEYVVTLVPSANRNFSTLLMGKSPGKRGSSNFMEVEESTMYENYPPRKPFINDPYERPPYKPVSTYPEGNRTAVVDALRNLQHKIHALELERTTAEDKLKSLARETSKYQDTLQRESEQRKPSQTSVSKHNQELESQLSVAETRCQLLEKQLENMRNMVSNAEKVKISAISKTIELDRLQEPVEHSSSFQENLRKIAELERDHMKLTANRNPCREQDTGERHHRKVIVEKAAESFGGGMWRCHGWGGVMWGWGHGYVGMMSCGYGDCVMWGWSLGWLGYVVMWVVGSCAGWGHGWVMWGWGYVGSWGVIGVMLVVSHGGHGWGWCNVSDVGDGVMWGMEWGHERLKENWVMQIMWGMEDMLGWVANKNPQFPRVNLSLKGLLILSVQKANRILQEADEKEREFKKPHKVKRATKKKKKVVSKKSGHCHKTDPAKHYRLNLNDIPFVAGKNTGPSYSVGANVQNVLSLMKSHNMALCSRATYAGGSCGSSTPSSSESSSPSTEHDLAEILIQLQDEFHQMSFEHQELSKEISDSEDPRMREDMERELEALVSRMEAKSLQISKIRGHQEKVANKKKKKSRRNSDGDEYSTPRSGHRYAHPRVSASPSPVYSGEVEVTTTIKPRGAGAGVVQIRPSSAREISLNVLKDMKKLQSTLRKDDLCWK